MGWHRPHEILSDWEIHNRLLAPPTLNLLKHLSTNQLPDAIRALNTVEVHQDHYACPHIAMFPQPTPTLPPATHTNAYLVGDKELILWNWLPTFQSDCVLIRELESRIENGARLSDCSYPSPSRSLCQPCAFLRAPPYGLIEKPRKECPSLWIIIFVMRPYIPCGGTELSVFIPLVMRQGTSFSSARAVRPSLLATWLRELAPF